jgi:hypothetical protein
MFVGIVGVLERLPNSFAFDSACAIALCAAVLGVAAVFATRRRVFLYAQAAAVRLVSRAGGMPRTYS